MGLRDQEFMGHIPGFEVFNEGSATNNIVPDSIRTKLTQALGEISHYYFYSASSSGNGMKQN